MSNFSETNNLKPEKEAPGISRRALLGSTVALAAAYAGGAGAAQSGHDHGGSNHKSLIDVALDCAKTGQICLDHCFEDFKKGNTSLAKCADLVSELIVMCNALGQMAAYKSAHLKDLARVTQKVCEDCKEECEKHKKHQICLDCAKSCDDCIKECKKLLS